MVDSKDLQYWNGEEEEDEGMSRGTRKMRVKERVLDSGGL